MAIWLGIIGYLTALGLVCAIAGASRRKQVRCSLSEIEPMSRYRKAEQSASGASHPLQAH
jgi:hypothetical protein